MLGANQFSQLDEGSDTFASTSASLHPHCGLVDVIIQPPESFIQPTLEENIKEEGSVGKGFIHIKEWTDRLHVKALQIKENYLPAKVTYFLFHSCLSLINTFFTIFLVNLGLDPKQAGLIQVARSGIMICSCLFWGWLAQKTNRNLLIICVELLVSTALLQMLPWIADFMITQESITTHMEHVKKALMANTTTNFSSVELENMSTEDASALLGLVWTKAHYKSGTPYLFIVILILSAGFTFFKGGALLLIETRVYNMTKSNAKGQNVYGRQRLWGSLGFAITPLAAGAIMEEIQKTNRTKEDPLQVVFYIYMVFMIGAVVSCWYLFRKDPVQLNIVNGAQDFTLSPNQNFEEITLRQVLSKIIKSHQTLMLFSNIFILGLVYGLQWNFQFIFMQEIGASKTMMGLCVSIQLVIETMVYPFAIKINAKVGCNKIITTLTVFSYAILFFVFSVANSPILMLIPTAFLGLFFTLFHNATMEDLHQIGGERFMTILQTLYHVIFTGLGCTCSGLVGGVVYKNHGGRALFFGTGAVLSFIGMYNVIYACIFRPIRMKSGKSNMTVSDIEEIVVEVHSEKEDWPTISEDEGIGLSSSLEAVPTSSLEDVPPISSIDTEI